jgi:hypothetical protein
MQIMLETGQLFIVDVSTVATTGEAALRTGGFSEGQQILAVLHRSLS